jgi:hypothetical protein
MRRYSLPLFLILALAFGAPAQQKRPAEAAPQVERLRAHVSYLASDRLEGRRTGTPGATAAAEYIAGEFARYGLRRTTGRDLPGMSILEADSPRRYMQEFPYVAGVELGRNNSMLYTPGAAQAPAAQGAAARAASLDLRPGEDWMPLGFSSSASLSNTPAVFVGYGIKVAELNYDDYGRAPVSNRVAVAFSGTPDGDNPHGQFARYGDVRWKAVAAREQGARALVVVASEVNFKDDRLTRLSYDNSGGEAGLPVVVISRQVAARFFGLGGVAQLDEFETKLRGMLKPAPTASATNQPAVKLSFQPALDFTLSLSTDVVRRQAPAYNVAGVLEGSDPALKNEVIVIGAHYDHLGRGGQGSLAARGGEIHHGADDNASGVAGVLELARLFSAEGMRPKRTLMFVAFGGEEEGLLGSNYFVNHPVLPLSQAVAMINMDMIGRMKENRLIIGGVGTAQEWRDLITENNKPSISMRNAEPKDWSPPLGSGFMLTLNEDGYGPSDHSSFYAKQIPVLFLFTGTHDDYHKPTDTAEKVNYEDEARVVSFVRNLVLSVDAGARRPTYATAKSESQGRSTGFRVYLGTIPNYSESNDGLKLDGVREDSPASKAGLRAGDRITRMAGREVRNVYDYTYALGEMKAGQEYEVEVVRGTETLKLKITPTARK